MTIDDFRAIPFNSVMQAANQATLTHGVFISLSSLGVQSPPELADSPLLGIPFAVKDNIDVLGLPTTGGTELLRSSFPSETATVVSRITGAGAVVVGKTNLHELAFGITSNNGSFGPVRNPHDPERSAGGSSGGSAVAVALGIVPFALGTDTGGSMQIPAAHCGIVGMRPSTGRYPADGVLRLSPTRDTIGVMASTVSDVAFIDGIITGEGELPATDLGTVRLGIPASGFFPGVDARIRNRFDALRLQDHGASFAQGLTSNPSDTLRSLQMKASYYYEHKYGVTLSHFSMRGSPDPTLYPGAAVTGRANGRPDTTGRVFELDYLPVKNVRLMMQYTAYTKFNGSGGGGYDGVTARSPRDNNTLFFNVWAAY